MTEVWRPIPGHTGYEASSLGRVRSVDRVIMRRNRASPGRRYPVALRGTVLALGVDRDGYNTVTLGGSGSTVHVGRLVAAAFHGAPQQGVHADHINRDRSDDSVGNVRWLDQEANRAARVFARGEAHGAAVLSAGQVQAIRDRVAAGEPYAAVADAFGVSRSNVGMIATRRTWAHV